MVTRAVKEEEIPFALGGRAQSVGSPQNVVSAVVTFANTEVAASARCRLEQGRISETDDENGEYVVYDGGELTELHRSNALRLVTSQIESERAFAIEMLAAAAQGKPQLIKWVIREHGTGRRSGVTSNPYLRVTGSDVSLIWALTGPVSATGWVLFAAAYLAELAKKTESGETGIGRCQLDTCRRFFRIERKGPGKPQKLYCCNEHMLEKHRLNSTERTRRARAKNRALAAMPRRRRHK